ncbi:MAG: DUF1559 domain-containing protein, partial [Algisphaera sp.]
KRFSKNAFTLIELLVVISIIALLIGILLPALGSARSAARDMKCLSNSKQMMIGVFGYLAEYNGTLPMGSVYGMPGLAETNWALLIDDYIRQEGGAYGNVNGQTQLSPVFLCPSAPVEGGWLHYVANTGLVGTPLTPAVLPADEKYARSLKIDSQSRLTELALIFDSPQLLQDNGWAVKGQVPVLTGDQVDGWNASDLSVARYLPNNSTAHDPPTFSPNVDVDSVNPWLSAGDIRFRHGGETTASFGFLDGHSSAESEDSLTRRNVLPDKP